MDADCPAMKWSAQLSAHSATSRGLRLPGDKIALPPSALEQLLSASAFAIATASKPVPTYDPWQPGEHIRGQRELEEKQQQQLPQPLTFRLVSPDSGRVIYAGIQEFSAEEDSIIVSDFIHAALGLRGDLVTGDGGEDGADQAASQQRITVHHASLPKGTFVKLRPLEAGYDVEDWKALLEHYMRSNFTTLSKSEILEVPGEIRYGKSREMYRFLVDGFKPDVDAICVVDTDLEVDIEALNEEQARETIKRIADKYRGGPDEHSSAGGELDLFGEVSGRVAVGDYVDYQLPSWPRDQMLEIEVETPNSEPTVDLLISPLSSRQRVRPRVDDYVLADWEDRPTKRLRLQPTNVELEDAEALYVTVHFFGSPDISSVAAPLSARYTLRVRSAALNGEQDLNIKQMDTPPDDGDIRCKNCGQWVPQRTLMLHENFCLRNNLLCPQGCGQVFQKGSRALEDHWHCPHDTVYGSGNISRAKHDTLYHPSEALACQRCSTRQKFSSSPLLASHHVSSCPAKLILCRFCHLTVAQEGDADGPNVEALLSGLTVHELQDGSRTTECHLCGKITRMRDMDTHMKHHDLERRSRPRPRLCRNVNCGNTLDGTSQTGSTRAGHDPGNDIGLCKSCYGPLYVSMYDPEGKALKRRIERRYLQQLMTGCGRPWCHNGFCRTGRKNADMPEEATSAKTALSMARLPVDAGVADQDSPLHFCVDEAGRRRQTGAELLHAELHQTSGPRAFALSWCRAAVEAEHGDLDKAKTWLDNYAPRQDEER